MKTATVRELRNNFARLSRWVQSGEEVKITKRGRAFAKLVGIEDARPKVRFDAKARLKKLREIYGGKVFKDNIVLTMREEKDW